MMQEAENARARSRGYNLLSVFMATGLSAAMLPALVQVDALAAALPTRFDADTAAAAHFEVFGRAIFASQSVFTDASAQRGGDEVVRVRATYAAMGFEPPSGLEEDSLACELAALAHLCAAEADAWRDGVESAVTQARTLQAAFLVAHMLRWLPPLCEALAQQPLPLYAAMGALLGNVVGDHAAELTADAVPLLPPVAVEQPHAPNPAAPATRLTEIVAWLLAPACAGFLLTHTDIQRAAAAAALSTGVSDRRATLMQLLQGAGAYHTLAPLLEALALRATQARAAYAEMEDASPTLAPWVRVWDARAADTLALLAAMRTAGGAA